jgi:hypothetical protein
LPAIDAAGCDPALALTGPPGLPPSRHTLSAASRKDCHLQAPAICRPAIRRPPRNVACADDGPPRQASACRQPILPDHAEQPGPLRTRRASRPDLPVEAVAGKSLYSGQPGTVASRAGTLPAAAPAAWFPGLRRQRHFQRSCPSSSSEPAIRAETTGAPCSSMARFAVHLKG